MRLRIPAPLRLRAAVVLAGWLPALAAALDQSLAQMDHTFWTARDGAPQAIRALAQGTDGTLWLGSESGLVNFDGRRFSAFESPRGEPPLPTAPVLSILVTRAGAVWVGFFQAGVARIAQGRVTLYGQAGDVPITVVESLREASDGSIWAIANQRQLIRFDGQGSWQREPAPSTARISGIHIDSANTLWLAQGKQLHRRPLAQAGYTATDVAADVVFAFAEAPDGIWIADVITPVVRGRVQLVDRQGALVATLPVDDTPSGIVRAADGSVLVSFQGKGVQRFRDGQAPDLFSSENGLSSNRTRSILVDLDGNVWIGGQRGLDRLRAARLVPFTTEMSRARWTVCAEKSGDLWIAATTGDIYKVSEGRITARYEHVGDAFSIYCKAGGGVIAVTQAGIMDVNAERISRIPAHPKGAGYALLQAMVASDSTVYARVSGSPKDGGGIWRHRNGEWDVLPPEDVREYFGGTVGYVDSRDRLWVGYTQGKVIVRSPEGAQSYSSDDPGIGWVFAILETTHGFFAAGTNGLAALRGARFDMLAFEQPVSVRGVRGLVEAANGDLWVNSSKGIVRVGHAELRRGLQDPAYRMKSELITEGEFAGAAQGTDTKFATAARDSRGHLWFATRSGVVYLDPARPARPSRPPIVAIRSVAADRNPLDERGLVDPRPQAVTFEYLGVNLTAPEKVVYRYRLDGLDEAWQDAGNRTEAIYRRLPPGTYAFQVMASSGDGAWSAPVSRPFTVLPSFYQTTWFAVLCGLAVILALWLAFTLRVRVITREVRARAEERADERIRIARELHDTLLQGIQGLLLTFHVAAQRMSPADEARPLLERALATADSLILEGRNRVASLRSEHLQDAELVGALQNAANDLGAGSSVQVTVKRSGGGAALRSHVADEVFLVGREALANAYRHANASRIDIELCYGRRYFQFRCTDDGKGFTAEERGRPGHWGLQGLAERARKLHGRARVQSKPGAGTEIAVALPSYAAYEGRSRAAFYLGAWRLSERNPLTRSSQRRTNPTI